MRMVGADFNGKIVIVTGALGGIGLATAEAFAEGDAKLMLTDLGEAPSDMIDRLIGKGAEKVLTMACDISCEAAIEALVERTLAEFGKIDVIVNVAGVMLYKPIAKLTQADWRAMLDINLIGAALLVREGLRHMCPGGAIVNIASIHARRTSAEVAAYAAAKAALVSLTRSAAIEGKPLGIRVNAILPGAVDTPMLRNSPAIAAGLEVLHEGDVGQPHEIAAAARFLASNEASFITGAEIVADGGRMGRL